MEETSQLQQVYLQYAEADRVLQEFLRTHTLIQNSKDALVENFDQLPGRKQGIRRLRGTPDAQAYNVYEQKLATAEANIEQAAIQRETIRKQLIHLLTTHTLRSTPLAYTVHELLTSLQSLAHHVEDIQEIVPHIQKQIGSDQKRELADIFTANSTGVGMVAVLGSLRKGQNTTQQMQQFAGQLERIQTETTALQEKLINFYQLIDKSAEGIATELGTVDAGGFTNMLESFTDFSSAGGSLGGILGRYKVYKGSQKKGQLATLSEQFDELYERVEEVYTQLEQRQAAYLEKQLSTYVPGATMSLQGYDPQQDELPG